MTDIKTVQVEQAAMVAVTEMLLHAVEEWTTNLNRYVDRKYGPEVADDLYPKTDALRLALRDALHLLEED